MMKTAQLKARARREWQNRTTAAAAQGVSVQAFDAWGVAPVAKIGREVFYLAGDITANRVANALAKAEQQGVSNTDAEQEKLLLVRAQREGQELKNAQTRNELAPIDLISWTLSKVAGQISAILDAVPLKVKNIAPRLTAAEVEHIRREIVRAKNAAASVGVNLDEYYDRKEQ
jgi:phage terminase Nu1 subunit (DNA packaging protein)